MHLLRLVSFASIICLPSTLALAQQSTSSAAQPAASDPQAVALLQGSVAALTSGAPVSDVTLTGTAQRIAGSDNETGTATAKARSDGSSRLDFNYPSGARSEIRNPSGMPFAEVAPQNLPVASTTIADSQPVGAWSGPDGIPHGIPSHNLMTDPTWFFPATTLSSVLASPANVVSYIGPETHNDLPTIHVRISQPLPSTFEVPPQVATLVEHLTQMDLYLAAGTTIPVALAFDVHPNNNAFVDAAIEIRFSDYRVINGISIPFHVQEFLNNGLVLDLQFSSAILNAGLPSTLFQIQ
jgi:hypothetical protein